MPQQRRSMRASRGNRLGSRREERAHALGERWARLNRHELLGLVQKVLETGDLCVFGRELVGKGVYHISIQMVV